MGSFSTCGSAERIMVSRFSIVYSGQPGSPGADGFPLRAKLAQAVLALVASSCASGLSFAIPTVSVRSVLAAAHYGEPQLPIESNGASHVPNRERHSADVLNVRHRIRIVIALTDPKDIGLESRREPAILGIRLGRST